MYQWIDDKGYTVLSDVPRYKLGFSKPGGATWLKARAEPSAIAKPPPFKPRGFARKIDYGKYIKTAAPFKKPWRDWRTSPYKQTGFTKPFRDWRAEQAADDHDQALWAEFVRINKALDLERRRKEYFKKRLRTKDYRSGPKKIRRRRL